MSKSFIRRHDLLAVAALTMLAVIMLGIGFLTSKTVKEVQLMRDAETAAMRWARLFEDRRDDTWATFRDRRSTDHANSIIWNSREVGRIISYELYDRDGKMFYSTGAANWQPGRDSGALLDSPITRKHIENGIPTTRLHNVETATGPSHYASVVIPFKLAKEHLGSVVAFVDQTEQADSLTHSFGIIATATVILLLTALGAAAYVVVSKSRERWHAEARVRYLSDNDELTGLPNRQSFDKKLEALLAEGEKQAEVAVVIIDINRFKEINDALGHTAGDSLLRGVAERLKANISDKDFVARLGSNEFALALTSASEPNSVTTLVARLRDALSSTYWIGRNETTCAFSIAAAISPADGTDHVSLKRHANLALDSAKSGGSGVLTFFERSMDVAVQRRREREQNLRDAVEKGEFQLNYQPQICMETDKISGFEALVRWHHPVHGKISPAYFIPLAEETELIIPIGEWVLRRACADAAAWAEPLNVAVNLSPVQFKGSGVADLVAEVLADTGLEPGRLELEITELMLIGDTDTVVAELDKLRDLGVAIAMDDFGTGYSSLSYISSFPFNKIKIDRSFIQSMIKDDALSAIVKCIIAMGRALGVTITAEGVETKEQARLLRDYGCHQMQGFLYGYPATAQECARQIADTLSVNPEGTMAKKANQSSAA